MLLFHHHLSRIFTQFRNAKFSLIEVVTMDVKHRLLQHKLLHHILHLNKMPLHLRNFITVMLLVSLRTCIALTLLRKGYN